MKKMIGIGIAGASLCLALAPTPSAMAESYPLPFDPFLAPETFGCKHLIVPGSEILPHNPVTDDQTVRGWRTLSMKNVHDKSVETLIIKGSIPVNENEKNKKTRKKAILIPAGGIIYDVTPINAHLPVGDTGLFFGKKARLDKKTLAEESCRNFSVLAGRSFTVGDSIITYLMPGPKKGPLVLWRTIDGVSVRPHPLDEYPAGHVPKKTSTRIFGVYTHAGQIAEYSAFSAPLIATEDWTVDGKKRTIPANSEVFPHFRAVPISCPIGHHIGFMVYNDLPMILPEGKTESLYGGYLKIHVKSISRDGKTVKFSLNGRDYSGRGGIDSLIGRGRVIVGIKNSLTTLEDLTKKK